LRLAAAWAVFFLPSILPAEEPPAPRGVSYGWTRAYRPDDAWLIPPAPPAVEALFDPPQVEPLPIEAPAIEIPRLEAASDPAAPPQDSYRLPGEFERQGTIFLGCGELATFYPDLLADVVEAVRHRVDVAALVVNAEGGKEVSEILVARGLPADAVHYVEIPHETMWIRDYGPLFVRRDSDGQAVVVDADYERFSRPKDDNAPAVLASQFQLAAVRAPVSLEGGNLISNGRGLCLTTTTLLERNRERGCDEEHLRNLLRQFFGAGETVFLEPLSGEPTGHVDMFAVFTDPDTVVVGEYDPFVDPVNAAILDRNATRLSQVRGPDGRLHVVRIPMPPRQGENWRTYTNVVFANGMLLTPIYGHLDPQGERAATEIYRRLLPNWRVAGIDVSNLIANGGALHCISMNAPRLVRWPAFPATRGAPSGPFAVAGQREFRG
jgi:agmatine/peptidylarginine deiminase